MRLLLSILAIVLAAGPASGAFGAGTHWRVTTGGAAGNGGGFDSGVASPGTDQSITGGQAYTDIVIGGTTTTATSMAHAFSATTNGPGNIINITAGAGCTVQRVEIISVAAGVATFDKSLGTAASTCTGQLGNPFALPPNIQTIGMVSGNVVDIASGTYTVSANITLGACNKVIKLEGYGSTPGDMGTMPLFTTATNSVDMFTCAGSSFFNVTFRNIKVTNTAGTRGSCITALTAGSDWANVILDTVILDGCSYGVNGTNTGAYGAFGSVILKRTEIKNCVNDGVKNFFSIYALEKSWVHLCVNGLNSFGTDFSTLRSDIYIRGSAITDNSAKAVTGWQIDADHGTFANNATGCILGTAANAHNTPLSITNSIFWGCGTTGSQYGIEPQASSFATYVYVSNNAYGNNGANYRYLSAGIGDITLSVSPFTSAADYSLNNTAGGGALLRGQAVPGAFGGGTFTGYEDVGAVQTGTSNPGCGGPSACVYVQ